MVTAHKAINNLFGSSKYHKPHYIFKSKYYEFYNRNIGLFSGNDNRAVGYLVGTNSDMIMRKSLLDAVLSAEFNIMVLSSKLS